MQNKIWLVWKDSMVVKARGSCRKFSTAPDMATARAVGCRADAVSFLGENLSELEKQLPGYNWSVEDASQKSERPYFVICGLG